MADSDVDVAVLGAGIAGCALAHHLAARHVGPILLYDPATPAAGATGRAAGIVTEQLWDPWDVEVARTSKAEYAELAGRWDPSAYTVNGFVRWTRDVRTAALLEESVERLRGWGVEVRTVGPDALAELVPAGRFDGVRGAIYGPDDAVVTPSAIAELYAESARAQGVDVRLAVPMRTPERAGGHWRLRVGSDTVRARRIVVAAGAWSKRLLAELGHALPLVPYRTQAAVLRPSVAVGAAHPSLHDLDADVYARPESGGRILAGDGTEHVEADPDRFPPGGDAAFVAHVAETFAATVPGWADAELVRAWAGVCTATPDRRPVVGPVDADAELYVVAGFNGFGVMRAGGVAARLAEALAAGASSPDAWASLAPVRPDRLAGRPLSFEPKPGFTLEGGDDPRL
ncbi:MAG TPA: FAD-binding oxidoreductase [Thermoplasmata archaeon]|nr:FAD-binding oxidoreductase [Thermoplasmata archaeon]